MDGRKWSFPSTVNPVNNNERCEFNTNDSTPGLRLRRITVEAGLPSRGAGRHRDMKQPGITVRAFEVFAEDAASPPTITLRGGEAIDRYQAPPSFDPNADAISDAYLRKYAGGLTFLDAASWRHYLPHLIEYTVRHAQHGSNAGDALLHNLRPPDREPPRLASLSPGQEQVVREFLEFLAFSGASAHQSFACQVLEEWWIPGALYCGTAE